MRQRRFSSVVLIFLLALIGVGLWWFMLPTAVAPAKTVAALTPAKLDSAMLAAQPTQVELPKAPAVPAHAEAVVATAPPSADPQVDLKTAIPDIARLMRAGDYVAFYEKYTPPDKLDPEILNSATMGLQREAVEAATNPELQQQLQEMGEKLAISYEALESQAPTYNATGDEVTYTYTDPGMWPPTIGSKTFIKINGKWYVKRRT